MTQLNFKFQISEFKTVNGRARSPLRAVGRSSERHDYSPRRAEDCPPYHRIVFALLFLLSVPGAFAATNSGDADEIPPLAPPRAEIPPGLWEQYGLWVTIGGIALLLVALFFIWRVTRPKPPIVVPIEVRTRETLLGLRDRPENGMLLSQVSQTLRRYVAGVFSLAPDEMTTTEFCQAVTRNEQIGTGLSTALGQFLRRCDELKFSPTAPKPPLGAVSQALNLVDLAEARREQLRAAEENARRRDASAPRAELSKSAGGMTND